MISENNSLEFENRDENFEYITPEVFERLNFPEKLPVYEGEGVTSFHKKHDKDKEEYLNRLGIEIPEEWKEDRAMLVSAFISTGLLLVLESVRRVDEENFESVVSDKNKQLKDARVDDYGYRKRLANGMLVEDVHRGSGFSANPQKKVTDRELKEVVNHVVEQLSEDK